MYISKNYFAVYFVLNLKSKLNFEIKAITKIFFPNWVACLDWLCSYLTLNLFASFCEFVENSTADRCNFSVLILNEILFKRIYQIVFSSLIQNKIVLLSEIQVAQSNCHSLRFEFRSHLLEIKFWNQKNLF